MLRAAIWAAVSSEEQYTIDKVSIPDQQASTCKKAKDLGATVIASLVVSESRELLDFTTACSTIAAYQELKQLVERKKIDLLIFLNRGRLGRTSALVESLALFCLRGGVALYDLSAPPSSLIAVEQLHSSGDQLSGIIQSWRYQNELTELRRRHHRGMINRVKKGNFAGSIPYGWKRQFDVNGNSKIVVDEMAAQAVRRMFDLYLANETIESIADLLNAIGYHSYGKIRKNPADRVNRPIRKGFVRSIVAKPMLYAGYVEVNRVSRHEREYVSEKSNLIKPIISEAVAKRTLEKLKRNQRASYSRGDHLFSGLIWCEKCERMMTVVSLSSGRKRRDGSMHYAPAVQCGNCRRKIAFSVLSRDFLEWLTSIDTYVIEDVEAADTRNLEKEAKKLQAQINCYPESKARAFSAYVDGSADREMYQAELKRLEERKKVTLQRLAELSEQMNAGTNAKALQQQYEHVKEIGHDMLELGATEPATVNRWLREHVKFSLGDSREVAIILV